MLEIKNSTYNSILCLCKSRAVPAISVQPCSTTCLWPSPPLIVSIVGTFVYSAPLQYMALCPVCWRCLWIMEQMMPEFRMCKGERVGRGARAGEKKAQRWESSANKILLISLRRHCRKASAPFSTDVLCVLFVVQTIEIVTTLYPCLFYFLLTISFF